MVSVIEYKGQVYPEFQSEGNAAQFVIPFAKHVCKGIGYDIGCGKLEWALPESIPVDLDLSDNSWHANSLPIDPVDYIFSSHCLEHVQDWVRTLDYWTRHIKSGGTLFLYLPHKDQVYWHPWNNTKHNHMFHPDDIELYLNENGYTNVFCSQRDLNHSFCAMGERQ